MSREQQIRDRVAAATPGPLIEGTDGNVRVYGPDNTEHAGLVAVFYGSRRRGNATLFANTEADIAYLLDRVKELEDALEIVNNGVDDFGGSYVNLQVQMSEVEEGRAVLAKRNL